MILHFSQFFFHNFYLMIGKDLTVQLPDSQKESISFEILLRFRFYLKFTCYCWIFCLKIDLKLVLFTAYNNKFTPCIFLKRVYNVYMVYKPK